MNLASNTPKFYELPPPPFKIFPAMQGDIPKIARIEAEAYPFPWSPGNFTDSMAAGYQVWVLRSGGTVAGYAVWMHVLDEAHLLNICVAPPYQNRGWGARLLRFIMALAWAGGARALFLEVRPSNGPARALYRRFRFRQIGVRKDYYPAAEGREAALVLYRELEETDGPDEAGGLGEEEE
ncbi:MAG: ribosomal protein S18-alanine N-acetyltransferase [Betaproteobacteria bacterium]|nr:ribosomal protein S18-alanine N-acetyltransferase [Betaproteobacteria bacterium]